MGRRVYSEQSLRSCERCAQLSQHKLHPRTDRLNQRDPLLWIFFVTDWRARNTMQFSVSRKYFVRGNAPNPTALRDL